MDHMESSSASDIKASDEDSKQDGGDTAANTPMDNPGLVSVSVGCHDESTLLEDVKVCDICGDAGREDMLAICSKCSDGAEHIYCMRKRLEKVPDVDWICEDCVLPEDKDKKRETKFSKFVASPKCNINESDQEIETSGAPNLKVNPVSDSRGLDIDKNRRDKLSCLSSAKRPLGNVRSALLMRRRALGLNNELTSRQHNKAPKSQDFAVKSTQELSLPKDLSGRSMTENADLLTVSGQRSPRSHQLLTSSGMLTKAKSFNGSERRSKVQFLDKNPEKLKCPHGTALSSKGKGYTFRSLKKSQSFSDANTGPSNALDVETKTSAPKLSEVSALKKLRHIKECCSVEKEFKPVLKKPRILSPDGSFSSGSSGDEKFASRFKPLSAHFSGLKCSDPKTIQNSSESGTACADEVKKLSTKSNPSQELKHKVEVTASSSPTSRRHLSCSDATGQNKLPALETSSHQNLKAPQNSDSSLPSGRTSDGTGSACRCKCETGVHALVCHSEDSSLVSFINTRREKDRTDLASSLCYHLNVYGSLAVPMFDYIWKGELEIHNSGRLPGVLGRIQAHLSTRSSPKIPEVVKKFSDKILLEEVSRLNTWPTQFLKYQPQDDSIGLYFFAEDIRNPSVGISCYSCGASSYTGSLSPYKTGCASIQRTVELHTQSATTVVTESQHCPL